MKREYQAAAFPCHEVVELGCHLRVRIDENLDNLLLARRYVQMIERLNVPLYVAHMFNVEYHCLLSVIRRKVINGATYSTSYLQG